MQLEIKIYLDFGDDADLDLQQTAQDVADDIKSGVTDVAERQLGVKRSHVSMGWTSSGDDEE